jgi:hypothetical protein
MIEITYKNTADLIPYINNSRTHSESQIKQVAASINEFGFTNPIIIDEGNTILAGHGRLQAAQLLGMDKVPTQSVEGWSEAKKKAYIIADNKLALNAGWDFELLKIELDTIKNLDFDVELTGFDEGEILNLNLEVDEGQMDADAEWEGMPEFDQPDATSFRKVIVHFENPDDVAEFFSIIGQSDTGKTKSTWFPEKERNDYEAERYS